MSQDNDWAVGAENTGCCVRTALRSNSVCMLLRILREIWEEDVAGGGHGRYTPRRW